MRRALFVLLVLFAALSTKAATRIWTNTLGGDWFVPGNWSPNAPPGATDNAVITNNGSYTISIITSQAMVSGLTLGGSSGTQTLLQGYLSPLTVTNSGVVRTNGVLSVTNGGLQGLLLVAPGGQLDLNGPSSMFFYDFSLTNQGTVNWGGGGILAGSTTVSNGGLWQMTGNDSLEYGGYTAPLFINGGILRNSTGVNTTVMGMDLINLPAGVVDAESGSLDIEAPLTNYLGGSFIAAATSVINFLSGSCTDAGGTVSGAGTVEFSGANFYLRTNIIAGIQLLAGNIYITGANTFQDAGAITNLTLNGAALNGTNRVAGTLAFIAGAVVDLLTIQPSGHLVMTNPADSKLIYDLTLINQGTVTCDSSGLDAGNTVISNGGKWLLAGDGSVSWGGYSQPVWTNSGTMHKTGGTGISSFENVQFANQPSGLVEADTGAIWMPNNYTNVAGELRLNGGQIQAFSGNLTLAGGTLDGTGGVGPNQLLGGTISPGFGGPGEISFPQSLDLGSNATVVISGTGTTPGSQYSQLSVTGAVALANCNLHVISLPAVPLGTAFIIITNDGTTPISGTFSNLPENTILDISGQPFRIHYNFSNPGADVVLVRDSGTASPALSYNGFTRGNWQLSGTGLSSNLFTLQATTNFLTWTNIGTVTSDGNGVFSFVDTNADHFRYRFYRSTN